MFDGKRNRDIGQARDCFECLVQTRLAGQVPRTDARHLEPRKSPQCRRQLVGIGAVGNRRQGHELLDGGVLEAPARGDFGPCAAGRYQVTSQSGARPEHHDEGLESLGRPGGQDIRTSRLGQAIQPRRRVLGRRRARQQPIEYGAPRRSAHAGEQRGVSRCLPPAHRKLGLDSTREHRRARTGSTVVAFRRAKKAAAALRPPPRIPTAAYAAIDVTRLRDPSSMPEPA